MKMVPNTNRREEVGGTWQRYEAERSREGLEGQGRITWDREVKRTGRR